MQPALRLTGGALGAALLFVSLSAQAAEAQKDANAETTLNAVTVVGNWLENPNAAKVLEHPGARTIIDRETFVESGATNVRDVLRRVPGVQVQDSNGTGGSDISLNVGVRGLTSRLSPRSTIMMDGIPLAVAPYGQPQLSMAPLALGNLEVSVGYRFLREASEEKATRTASYLPGSAFDAGSAPMNLTSGSVGGTTANAVYIDDTIDIGNWTITPGLRYEFIRSYATALTPGKPDVRSDVSANEPLPSLSVMYHVNDKWNVFANAGVSFGPMQYFQIVQSTNNLQPEKAKTYEIGTHVEGLNGWAGELTLFNIDFSQELQLNNGEWTNLGATTHRGVEAGLRYDFSRIAPTLAGLSAYATYTYTSATFDQGNFSGRDLPFYSRHVGTVGMRYERNRWSFNIDAFAQSKQRSPGDPSTSTVYQTAESANGALGDIPGYMLTNIRAGYDIGKNAKVAFGIKNLFDRRYFTRSNDQNFGKYVGMPRTFYVQATLSY